MLRPKVPPILREPQLRLTKLGLTTVPTDLSDSDLVKPHILCPTCQDVFAKSRTIRQLSIEAEDNREHLAEAHTPSKTESFSWVTPENLRLAHITRCHFCLIALQRLYEESKYYSRLLWSNFHDRPPDLPLHLEFLSRAGQCIVRTMGPPDGEYMKGFVIAAFSAASGRRT